jgi:hypothetical protein
VDLRVLLSGERAVEELGNDGLCLAERTGADEMTRPTHSFFIGHRGRFVAERG